MRVPDVVVTCEADDPGVHALAEPILIVEVLSPSNEAETRENVWAYTTIPTVGHALLPGDMADGAHQRGNLLRRGVLRKIVERDVFALGDRQHMSRALRADVVESEDVRILVDLVAGDLAAQDAGEDIVAVVGHRLASAME